MPIQEKQNKLLRESEAAEYLWMSISWMQRSRWNGLGPKFVKAAHAVRYRQADLDAWVNERVCNSTSQTKGDKNE